MKDKQPAWPYTDFTANRGKSWWRMTDRLPRIHSGKRSQAQAGYKGDRMRMEEERLPLNVQEHRQVEGLGPELNSTEPSEELSRDAAALTRASHISVKPPEGGGPEQTSPQENLHLLTRAGSVTGMRAGSGTKLAWTLTLRMALDQPLLLSVQLFSCARASSIPPLRQQTHSSGSQVSTEGRPAEATANVQPHRTSAPRKDMYMYTSDKDQDGQSQGTTVIQQKRLQGSEISGAPPEASLPTSVIPKAGGLDQVLR